MERRKKGSYLTHLALYRRDYLALSFWDSPCCAALRRAHMIYKEIQEQGLLWRQRSATHQQPNVQGEPCGTEQVLGNMEGSMKQDKGRENTIKNKWGRVLCHRPDLSRITLPTPLSPVASACFFSGRGALQHPIERVSRLCVISVSPLPAPCNHRSYTDPSTFHRYQPTFLQKQGFFQHPSADPAVSLSA